MTWPVQHDGTPFAVTARRAPLPVLRVAHVIHSLGPGGAENVLVELARAAPGAALELVVIAISPVADPVHARTLRGLGVPVVELGLGRWDPSAVVRTAAALRRFEVDIVHTHLKHADIVGGLAARAVGLRSVSTLHVIEDVSGRRIDRFKRSAALAVRGSLARRVIAVSEAQRQWYADLAGSTGNLVVEPNAVADPGEPQPGDRLRIREEIGVPDDGLLVVSASLMRPEKGHDLLLDAISLLPELDRPVVVALAGDGPLRDALHARVRDDARLDRMVRFLGYRTDVPELLDALPTTLIHALAAGVPVVATGVGGIPDIVAEGAGVLTGPDAPEIARAVHRLLAGPAERQRMGSIGRARFLRRFEAGGWAMRLRAVYDSVRA
jgi:glycosyltransferase involved in cell wall biosynthesis